MKLNKSKGNMYDFVTHTGNVVKGLCPHGCSYCYMKRWGKQNPIRFDEEELKIDMGSGNFVFVGSSCDMFAHNIPKQWILDIFEHCAKFDNKYLFQSKNPERFLNFKIQSRSIYATTIETNRFYPQMGMTPSPFTRALSMFLLSKQTKTYVTIEPVMDFDLKEMVELTKRCNPEQVNIGADSGNNNLPEPPKDKLLALIDELQKFTVINNKSNLKRI
ncbi:MAG TPA: hypothetical protein VMX17_04130 [Candidatus Glassbacteria bacterium]|nr:hypothetical protein [Candidatus Glassbacteria bacterium]